MPADDLTDPSPATTFGHLDATVVLSRHSGEVLLAEGDVRRALPYGSALKPFVYAAGKEHPVLAPRRGVQEWACGPGLPEKLDARLALLQLFTHTFGPGAPPVAAAPRG